MRTIPIPAPTGHLHASTSTRSLSDLAHMVPQQRATHGSNSQRPCARPYQQDRPRRALQQRATSHRPSAGAAGSSARARATHQRRASVQPATSQAIVENQQDVISSQNGIRQMFVRPPSRQRRLRNQVQKPSDVQRRHLTRAPEHN